MICPRPLFSVSVLLALALVLFQLQFLPLLVSAFNVSFVLTSFIDGSTFESDSGLDPRPLPVLQDVLKAIAKRKKWDLESIRVSKLEKARYARFQRHDFRYRVENRDLSFRLSDKLGSWVTFEERVEENNFAQLVERVSSVVDLDPFEVEGPVELLVIGENRASLQLPQNTTLNGVKRVIVGEGITVRVTGAQELSLLRGSCSESLDGNKPRAGLLPFEHLFSTSLFPVHISGPASLSVFRKRNPAASIEANLLSEETVQLNPDKCYPDYARTALHCPVNSLNSTIASVEKLLKRLLGERSNRSGNHFSSSVRVNVTASTLVTFQVELEREVGSGDAKWGKVADWRTKPKAELVWFEVTAGFDGYTLHPLEVKSVKPFIGVDTTAWSDVLPNVSFTEFPMLLLPPRTLTLDVNW